jgi:hypothetical protein
MRVCDALPGALQRSVTSTVLRANTKKIPFKVESAIAKRDGIFV